MEIIVSPLDYHQRGWNEALHTALVKLLRLHDEAVMSKFVTQGDCQAYRYAVKDCMDAIEYLKIDRSEPQDER
jgi:hypothetical protein